MEKSGIPQCKCYILHKFEDSIIAVGYKEAIEDLMCEQMRNQLKNVIDENGKRIESFNLEFDVANFKGVIKSVPRFV